MIVCKNKACAAPPCVCYASLQAELPLDPLSLTHFTKITETNKDGSFGET